MKNKPKISGKIRVPTSSIASVSKLFVVDIFVRKLDCLQVRHILKNSATNSMIPKLKPCFFFQISVEVNVNRCFCKSSIT